MHINNINYTFISMLMLKDRVEKNFFQKKKQNIYLFIYLIITVYVYFFNK